ncbi:MAG: GreA/GreB family elongation factor [Planctomycetes bacterium]|nr:GreA/GreB family elongation factor [Planctomycetota bacterium]
MVSSLNKETARITQLIKQEQLGEIESAWSDALQKAPKEIETFLSLADKLTRSGHGEKAGTLLEQVVSKLDSLSEPRLAAEVLAELAKVAPRNANQKALALTVFTNAYGAQPGFEKAIERAETASKENENRFVKALCNEMAFQPGDWLHHDAGWGLGQVKSMDVGAAELIIDFKEKTGHKVKMGAAANFFKKLPPEDIMVQREADIDALKRRCKDDPQAVILGILKGHDNKSNLKRIKAELVPRVIDAKSWTKWWANVRKDLARHQYVRVGTGANPAIERLVTAMTHEDETRELFDNAIRLPQKLAVLRRYLKDSAASDARKTLLEHIGAQVAAIVQREGDLDARNRDSGASLAGDRIVGWYMIEDIRKCEPTANVGLNYSIDDLVRGAEDILRRIEEVRDSDYQGRALQQHTRLDSNWPTTYGKAFLKNLASLWDMIARALIDNGNEKELHDALTAVAADPDVYPLQYLWFAKRGILGQSLPKSIALPTAQDLFARILWVMNKVLTRIERGETGMKETLATLRAAMTERNSRLLATAIEGIAEERAAHLLHEIDRCRGLSDIHNSTLREILLRSFPNLQAKKAAAQAAEVEAEGGGEILATANGQRKREAELKRIQEEELPDVARQIGEALAMGDISENAELDAAREREGRLKEAAKGIMEELKRVRVIESGEVDPSKAGFGTKVTLKREDGKTKVYEIFGRYEADLDRGIISIESPIAQGILGKTPGESAQVQTPEGVKKYDVISVERAF